MIDRYDNYDPCDPLYSRPVTHVTWYIELREHIVRSVTLSLRTLSWSNPACNTIVASTFVGVSLTPSECKDRDLKFLSGNCRHHSPSDWTTTAEITRQLTNVSGWRINGSRDLTHDPYNPFDPRSAVSSGHVRNTQKELVNRENLCAHVISDFIAHIPLLQLIRVV